VATDIISGEEVVIREARSWKLSAPASLFRYFYRGQKGRPFPGGRRLVNNVPVSVAHKMGADYVIGRCHPSRHERAEHLQHDAEVKEPGLLQVMVQSIYITTYLTARAVTEGADVVIHPKLAHINPPDFHKARECILEGELAAVDLIPRIKRN